MGYPPMTPQSEKEFQTDVLRLAGMFGWRTFHDFDSRRSTPGFPDLVAVKPPRLIFAELKSDTGKLRPDQVLWLDDLTKVESALDRAIGGSSPVEVYVWRPSDLQFIAATFGGTD